MSTIRVLVSLFCFIAFIPAIASAQNRVIIQPGGAPTIIPPNQAVETQVSCEGQGGIGGPSYALAKYCLCQHETIGSPDPVSKLITLKLNIVQSVGDNVVKDVRVFGYWNWTRPLEFDSRESATAACEQLKNSLPVCTNG